MLRCDWVKFTGVLSAAIEQADAGFSCQGCDPCRNRGLRGDEPLVSLGKRAKRDDKVKTAVLIESRQFSGSPAVTVAGPRV